MRTIKTMALAVSLANAATAHALMLDAGSVDAQIYGQVELIGLYDLDRDIADDSSKAGLFGAVSTVGVDDRNFSGAGASFTANTSRLGVLAEHESGWSVRVEGDFYDGFRLRHAYGEIGNWLAGQTWTNVSTVVGRIKTIDYEGLTGHALEDRTPQIRFTSGPWSVALEQQNDYSTVVVNSFDFACTSGAEGWGIPCRDEEIPDLIRYETIADSGWNSNARTDIKLPALTARFEEAISPGLVVSVAGVVHKIESKTDATGLPQFADWNMYRFDYVANNNGEKYLVNDSLVGHALFAAADYQVNHKIALHGGAFHSNGANSYTHASGADFGFTAPDAVTNTLTGELEALESFGGTIGATIYAGPGQFGLGYGVTRVKWESVGSESDWLTKRNENAFANYIMPLAPGLTTGIEYGYYKRTLGNNDDGEAHRLMANVKFEF